MGSASEAARTLPARLRSSAGVLAVPGVFAERKAGGPGPRSVCAPRRVVYVMVCAALVVGVLCVWAREGAPSGRVNVFGGQGRGC